MFRWFVGDCPNCGKEVSQHELSAWCNSCGWARNRYRDPGTGRYIARYGMLGETRE